LLLLGDVVGRGVVTLVMVMMMLMVMDWHWTAVVRLLLLL